MTKFTATLPNGEIVTRNSKTKTYTHVVVATNPYTGEEIDWSWSGSQALAVKAQAEPRRQGFQTKVIPVN